MLRMQADMLDLCAKWLKPRGRLVYSTCSLLPVEGETQIERFLARNDTLTPVDINAQSLGLEADWSPAQGQIRLRPDYWLDRGGMDGFFMALLEKQ